MMNGTEDARLNSASHFASRSAPKVKTALADIKRRIRWTYPNFMKHSILYLTF